MIENKIAKEWEKYYTEKGEKVLNVSVYKNKINDGYNVTVHVSSGGYYRFDIYV